MMKSALLAVAVVAFGFGLAAPAHADSGWAALAYSHSATRHLAWKGGPGATQDSAEQAALAACGAPDCRIIPSGSCVSYSFDGAGHIHGLSGETEQQVMLDAFLRYGATDEPVKCYWDMK
jgi:Domain of unknown function (DUF4189)